MPFVIGTSPILPIPILWLLLIAFVAIQVFAFLKSKKINIFHALAFLTMLIFALNPQIIDIVKKDRPQKIIIIKDYSASMMAVSYTHLDVYKRQGFYFGQFAFLNFGRRH